MLAKKKAAAAKKSSSSSAASAAAAKEAKERAAKKSKVKDKKNYNQVISYKLSRDGAHKRRSFINCVECESNVHESCSNCRK